MQWCTLVRIPTAAVFGHYFVHTQKYLKYVFILYSQSLQNPYLKKWMSHDDGCLFTSLLETMVDSYWKWITEKRKGYKKALTEAGKAFDAVQEVR